MARCKKYLSRGRFSSLSPWPWRWTRGKWRRKARLLIRGRLPSALTRFITLIVKNTACATCPVFWKNPLIRGRFFWSACCRGQRFLNIYNFGINKKTGIDVQGEVSSRNEALKTGSEFGLATASFGQGIEMTPMQLVKAFCAFANGGRGPKPYMVEKIVHGTDELATKPQLSGQVISAKTASQVTTMLVNVVEKGFGDGAKIKGYYLAGKTGTAEVPIEGKKGYYTDRTVQSFIGFGPALNPEFLILVKLDNPKVP